MNRHFENLNRNINCVFWQRAALNYHIQRLCILGSFIITPMIVMFLVFKDQFDPGVIALVLTSGVTLDQIFYWILYSLGNMETYFISFERCLKFTSVIQEEQIVPKALGDGGGKVENEITIAPKKPQRSGKSSGKKKSKKDTKKIDPYLFDKGAIEFKNLKIRYRENLPCVLKGLSFTV